MTDQQIAEQIAVEIMATYPLNEKAVAARIAKALTLARSEGREEGMKEKDALSRRDVEGLLGRQPAAPTDRG